VTALLFSPAVTWGTAIALLIVVALLARWDYLRICHRDKAAQRVKERVMERIYAEPPVDYVRELRVRDRTRRGPEPFMEDRRLPR